MFGWCVHCISSLQWLPYELGSIYSILLRSWSSEKVKSMPKVTEMPKIHPHGTTKGHNIGLQWSLPPSAHHNPLTYPLHQSNFCFFQNMHVLTHTILLKPAPCNWYHFLPNDPSSKLMTHLTSLSWPPTTNQATNSYDLLIFFSISIKMLYGCKLFFF